MTRYQKGQHFGTHEDAFPTPTARSNGFQRRATVLLYLNDCADGGRTHFDVLNVSSPPKRGTALVFFPALADGTPDDRTLHAALQAGDEKWVTQQWVACGLGVAAAAEAPPLAVGAGGGLFGKATVVAAAPAAAAPATQPKPAAPAAPVAGKAKKAGKGFGAGGGAKGAGGGGKNVGAGRKIR